ncbi:MAG: hypothetical protein AB1515_10685, partial [Nitrospirota bacterium]
GAAAASLGIFRLVAVGPLAAAMAAGATAAGMAAGAVHRCQTVEEARALLRQWLREAQLGAGDLILVKGSRSTRMERVLDGVMESAR